MKSFLLNNGSFAERGAINPLINQTSSKAEGKMLDEFNKQIFCTILVKTCTWDGSSALMVLIDDVTDKTQTEFIHMHTREKQQQTREAENFKATCSHEMRTPI